MKTRTEEARITVISNAAATRVPFNKLSLMGPEFSYMAQAAGRGQISGDGAYTEKCQRLLEQALGVPQVFLTPSCTHALEMASLLLDIRPKHEIIVPSFTFPSTVNAFALHGARPVFVDIRPDTLNLDERCLAEAVTPQSKAIVLVHYAGVGCEMDSIMPIAHGWGLPVVEDNAHGLFGKYSGKALGTFGCLAAQSFHETKNFTCGEGGALLINDPGFIERAEILREKGTDRRRFIRGQVDKYTWMDVGSSYLMSDLLAAFLYAQLEVREKILEIRRRLWQFYAENLQDWATEAGVKLPTVPPNCTSAHHIFYMLMPSRKQRDALVDQLAQQGIAATFHYQPLHTSPMGSQWGYRLGQLPVTERISDCLVRLPFYNNLSTDDQSFVVEAVTSIKL